MVTVMLMMMMMVLLLDTPTIVERVQPRQQLLCHVLWKDEINVLTR